MHNERVSHLIDRLEARLDEADTTWFDLRGSPAVDLRDAVIALRALSVPEAGVVAWQEINDPETITTSHAYVKAAGLSLFRPLYTLPPSQQEVTEAMLERAVSSFEAEMGEDRPSRRVIHNALEAALSHQKGE